MICLLSLISNISTIIVTMSLQKFSHSLNTSTTKKNASQKKPLRYYLPTLLLLCGCWWWCGWGCGCCCIWGTNAGWGSCSNFGSSFVAAATGIGPAFVIVVMVAAGIISVDIVNILDQPSILKKKFSDVPKRVSFQKSMIFFRFDRFDRSLFFFDTVLFLSFFFFGCMRV